MVQFLKPDPKVMFYLRGVSVRPATSMTDYELGEWIAEDVRPILDSHSPYPHAYAFRTDLLDPKNMKARQDVLRKALKL